jgi:lipooligosaccharide transport system permease protein
MTLSKAVPSPSPPSPPSPPGWVRLLPGGTFALAPVRLLERNLVALRSTWLPVVAGMFEPVLYLLSVGLGVGALIGTLPGPGGQPVSYQAFVAPGFLAASAMIGATFDTTFNFFVKLKYLRTYDAVLATPLTPRAVASGEVIWSLLRGAVYAAAFLVAMLAFGLVASWWALLALPAAVLIGFAFAGAGMAATTWMRSYVDFDFVNLALVPLFLFSATFFPLSRYPPALAFVIQLTPLYQGVAIERGLILGDVGWELPVHAAYLVVMGVVGLRIAGGRLQKLLQP